MSNLVINAPYDDYVEMLVAKTKLDAIKKMVETGTCYCSGPIMILLGLDVEQKADGKDGTD